ncbi:MAG: hypothetical protein ACPLPT_08145 [Moorellales bacterium]
MIGLRLVARFFLILAAVGLGLVLLLARPTSATGQFHPWVRAEWRETSSTAHPTFISPTASGNLLVVRNGYLGPSVVELDQEGRKVWEYGPVQATAAVRLANGHTLICDSGAPGPPAVPRVIEVNAKGEIVWEYPTTNRTLAPQHAQRLANGNTLVTYSDRVEELTPQGRRVWRSQGFFLRASWARRLGNGHTLVVERGLGGGGRVVELDAAGRPCWQYPARADQPVLLDPVAADREGDLTRILDLGAARVWFVDAAANPVQVIDWQELRQALPLANLWAGALTGDGHLYLSLTYTSGRSAVLRVELPAAAAFPPADSAVPLPPTSVGEPPAGEARP